MLKNILFEYVKKTMYSVLLVVLVLLLLWLAIFGGCGSKSKEKYQYTPDPCVHMMETGFSNKAVRACQAYAMRCKDSCEPYPVTTQMVSSLYNKYGVGEGNAPSADIDAKVVKDLQNANCITGLGPGNPCTPGEEECYSGYQCNPEFNECQCTNVDVFYN